VKNGAQSPRTGGAKHHDRLVYLQFLFGQDLFIHIDAYMESTPTSLDAMSNRSVPFAIYSISIRDQSNISTYPSASRGTRALNTRKDFNLVEVGGTRSWWS
jgi:hypothetical protein